MINFKTFRQEEKERKQKHIKKYAKIPVEEHAKLGFSLYLMGERLWELTNYQPKTIVGKQLSLIKQIEKLRFELDNEFYREHLDITSPYFGNDNKKIRKIISGGVNDDK
jgi:hypothetical protein